MMDRQHACSVLRENNDVLADRDGQRRFVTPATRDTGARIPTIPGTPGAPPIVDMGPFLELLTEAAVLGDLDGNGTVEACDLLILVGAWGWCDDARLDDDCTVSASDLVRLLGNEW